MVISDVDVLWLRNPLPYFQRYPEADILTSSDNMAATVGRGPLRGTSPRHSCRTVCGPSDPEEGAVWACPLGCSRAQPCTVPAP